MKKVAVLLLAAGLVFGAAHKGAQAADIKVSGEWDFNTEWNNIGFAKEKADDLFHARQRLRTQVDIIASESLKGTVFFEVGDTNWGNSSEGGALGTDGKVVEVRYSYVDWVVPQTDLRVRMGLQPFNLPNFVAGDPIMGSDDSDGAGITLSYQFNDMAGMSLFWMRAENDNTTIDRGVGNAMDFVGLSVPLTGEGWQLNPWGMYGNLGKNSLNEVGENGESLIVGLLPYGQDGVSVVAKDSNNPAWWLGIGGELTTFDPLRLAFDFAYGKADWGKAANGQDLTRQGWLLSGIAEYKLDYVTPGLIAWYGSGDNSDTMDGSERLPTLSPGWDFGRRCAQQDSHGHVGRGRPPCRHLVLRKSHPHVGGGLLYGYEQYPDGHFRPGQRRRERQRLPDDERPCVGSQLRFPVQDLREPDAGGRNGLCPTRSG